MFTIDFAYKLTGYLGCDSYAANRGVGLSLDLGDICCVDRFVHVSFILVGVMLCCYLDLDSLQVFAVGLWFGVLWLGFLFVCFGLFWLIKF